MKRMIGAAALLAATAALAACGGAKKDPNALTEEENRQLDNAAFHFRLLEPESERVGIDGPMNQTEGRYPLLGKYGETLVVDASFVEQQLSSIARNADLSRYVL